MQLDPLPTRTAPRLSSVNVFKIYSLFVRDTARLSDRRQALNAIYISVNSVLMGAVALLIQLASTVSAVFVAVEIFVALAGLLITRQWAKTIEKYRSLLAFRYQKLIAMEADLDLDEQHKMYSREAEQKLYGFSEIERQLPRTFRWLYVIGVALLLLTTIASRLGLIHELRVAFDHLLRQLGLPSI